MTKLGASSDCVTQVDRLLATPSLSWLLGAGISFESNIPPMYPLTKRVAAILAATSTHAALYKSLVQNLNDGYHIEHVLSQIGDYITLADRSKGQAAKIGQGSVSNDELRSLHSAITSAIADTVRWGYKAETESNGEIVGTRTSPIVTVDHHVNFIEALFRFSMAGLHERRQPVRLFTTNYDTLLEDALALSEVRYWDGFSGGAIAYRTHRIGSLDDLAITGCRCHLIKLHGSVDWRLRDGRSIIRVRDSDSYPTQQGPVLIYPQSTKYIATQRDPFASQFELMRKYFSEPSSHVLAICGYGFGDDHINDEIELLMQSSVEGMTIIAFCPTLPEIVTKWLSCPWGSRVHAIHNRGITCGTNSVVVPAGDADLDWWTFAGVTKLLKDGCGSHLQ